MMILFFTSVIILACSLPAQACMTILVGKNASDSGEILVGHNEDAPGRFTMQTHLVHKKRRGPGKSQKFEPDLADIDLYETRANLFWSEAKTYSDKFSTSAFCDFYANGHGVVICSNNCACSKEDKPDLYHGGIGYGLRRLVAERSYSAEEALEIACNLVDKYGYASSGRSYAFADKDEIYVMQIVHGKHYAIQRVPDDEVAVIPNHYTIHEPDKTAQGYEELIDYATKCGWYDPEDGAFDFAKVYQAESSYGLEKNTHRHVRAFEILLDMDLSALLQKKWEPLPFSIKPAHKISIEDLKHILRTHYEGTFSYAAGIDTPHFTKPLTICNNDTLESTIAQIRYNPERIILRKALGHPCYSPYIPWYFGIISDPEGYEDKDAEKSLAEHFFTKPEDMDYRDNAWFRTMEIQAACDILYDDAKNLVHSRINAIEKKIERELRTLDSQIELRLRNEPDIARAMMEGALMTWTGNVEEARKALKAELNIITGESENKARPGEKFRVRISGDKINFQELDMSKCKCGPSYMNRDKWSQCLGINKVEGRTKYFELEFGSGEWISDAIPCFTDMYMILVDKAGKKFAGSVKIQVQKF